MHKHFNADPYKQAVELLFSRKRDDADHAVLVFNDVPVAKVNEHKHLGIILDTRLSFSAHIKSINLKTRKGIVMLKYLSNYLLRNALNQLYKVYVRPHLDYGDVIYHSSANICDFSHSITLPELMDKLESVQYLASLATTGTWRGTSHDRVHLEVAWESLNYRRWNKRLTYDSSYESKHLHR